MTALRESFESLPSPMQPQLHAPAIPDRGPTLPDAAFGSELSRPEGREGTPPGGTSSVHLKIVQPMFEIMGYRARRDLPMRTWAVWRFMFSMTLTLLQITAIAILIPVAFVRGENDSCHWLTTSNIVWGAKLALFQLYPDVWFLCKRLTTRAEPVQGVPVVRVCPPDQTTLMNLLTFLEVLLVIIWTLVQVIILVVHGKRCYAHAPRVSTLAVVLLALALLYYLPTTLLLTIRRSRERRSEGRDDIEIGPLPKSAVDRIALVYYIPPPAPAPTAPARPSGPVAGFRRLGPVSRGLRTTTSDERRPHEDNGEWEKSFQRMPRAFLRIEKHEAQCAVCLDEYTAPPRVAAAATTIPGSAPASADADAQGVPEPLRWLDCGHVFHKRCIDPYITTETARCPTCRAPVRVGFRGRK